MHMHDRIQEQATRELCTPRATRYGHLSIETFSCFGHFSLHMCRNGGVITSGLKFATITFSVTCWRFSNISSDFGHIFTDYAQRAIGKLPVKLLTPPFDFVILKNTLEI